MPVLLALAISAFVMAAPASALEFRVMGLGEALDGLSYDEGTEQIELTVPQLQLSPVFRFSGGRSVLELYKTLPGLSEAEPTRLKVAEIAVPQGMQRAVLVFLPQEERSSQLRTAWIDDSEWREAHNQVRFYNLSDLPVAIRSEGEQWLLEPGMVQRAKFAKTARSLPLKIAAKTADNWELVHTNRLAVRNGFNAFVFLRGGVPDEDGFSRAVDLVCVYERQLSSEQP